MRSLRVLDIVSGFVIAGIGLAFLASSFSITDMLGERLPPWLLPMSLSGITVVAGLVLSFKSWRSTLADIEVEWPVRCRVFRQRPASRRRTPVECSAGNPDRCPGRVRRKSCMQQEAL